MSKDDLVSSRPISPSEFLHFPVDEVKDVIGGGAGGGGISGADLTSALDQSFSSPNHFFVGNGDAFDPFADPFQDFSPPYHLEEDDVTNRKRINPFQSDLLCLDDDGDDTDGDEDDFYDVASSLGPPVKRRTLLMQGGVDAEDDFSLYDGLDVPAVEETNVKIDCGVEGGTSGGMELEDLSSEEEPMPDEDAEDGAEPERREDSAKTASRDREQIPKDIECSVDFEEIDDMLERGLEGSIKSYRRKADGKIIDVKTRHHLRQIEKDPFEVLPDGWIEVMHESGMPIYLQRKTRIVSLSKPYCIGHGSARKHEIPHSAVPCYQYRLAKERRAQAHKDVGGNEDVITIQEPGITNVVPVIRNPPEPNKESTAKSSKSRKQSSAAAVRPPSPPISSSRSEDVVPFLSSSPSSPPPLVGDSSSPPPPPPLPSTPSSHFAPPLPPPELTPTSLPPPPPSPLSPLSPFAASLADSETPLPPPPAPLPDGDEPMAQPPPPSLSSSLPLECPFKGKSRSAEVVAEPNDGDDEAKEKSDAADGEADKEKENKPRLVLKPADLFAYCTRLFEFDSYTVKRFRSWKDRRDHMKVMKKIRPQIQSKLITYKLPGDPTALGKAKLGRQFQLNPVGKSPICVLHEYVQHVLKISPEYIYRELENPQEPYSCTVALKGVEYGTGTGSSKKTAKMEAAKRTMKVLIPHLYGKGSFDDDACDDTISFFDDIKTEDPRVTELSQKSGQPPPYQILIECLKRNYGMGNTDISMSMELGRNPKRYSKFTMTVGKHTRTVRCKNKKFGKQMSAQGILQLLHPHVNSWGSLLRLYGYDSRQRNERRKREEEQAVTELQSRAKPNRPNLAILDKLKLEMKKLDALRIAYEKTKRANTFTPADKNDLPYNKTALPTLDL